MNQTLYRFFCNLRRPWLNFLVAWCRWCLCVCVGHLSFREDIIFSWLIENKAEAAHVLRFSTLSRIYYVDENYLNFGPRTQETYLELIKKGGVCVCIWGGGCQRAAGRTGTAQKNPKWEEGKETGKNSLQRLGYKGAGPWFKSDLLWQDNFNLLQLFSLELIFYVIKMI